MSRESGWFLFVTLIAFVPAGSIAQVVQITSQYGTANVLGGEYRVHNNVWGASTPQTLEVDQNSTSFQVLSTGHNNTGGIPASYPFILKGSHFGGAPTTGNNPLPMKIRQIGAVPFTWAIATDSANGKWNAALDVWFNTTGSGSANACELMIWIDSKGGAVPAGSKVTTLSIGGLTWDLFYGTGNIVTYKIAGVRDSVNMDIKKFIDDAVSRGYLYTSWYLVAIEAGFEIWIDGAKLKSRIFTASVDTADSVANFPPAPFRLTRPYGHSTVMTRAVTFVWGASSDQDGDPLEYTLHVYGGGGDTTIAHLTSNSLDFNGNGFFKDSTAYYWTVSVTDGYVTVQNTGGPGTFETQGLVNVKEDTGVPAGFSLEQNYPNPFNPYTDIVFSVDRLLPVDISVYDLLGNKVATLAHGPYERGINRVRFDASNLPSGTYFVRLVAAAGTLVRKCMYIK